MIQGGCPDRNGSGNTGYHLEDEFHESLKHDAPGVVSMANIGPDTNSSQFFILTEPATWLDGNSSIIGKLVKGGAIVQGLEIGDIMESIKIQGSVKDLYRLQAKNIEKWNKILDAKRDGESN